MKKTNKGKASVLAVALVASSYSGFHFSERSKSNLDVCPPLIRVSECAIKRTTVDFMIIDGMRTAKEHKVNVDRGVSWVKRSLHQDGLAIDFVVWKNGGISWTAKDYFPVSNAFKKCAKELDTPIIWGGDWRVKDYGHIELKNRVCFPKKDKEDV